MIRQNIYIKSGDFFIKDNLRAYLLYFDYFLSQGLPLTNFFRNSYLRRQAYRILRFGTIFLYVSTLYKLRYKTLILNEEALVIFKGPGAWSNIIKLVDSKDGLKIQKKVFSNKIFIKERRFYEKYKNNSSNIKLPKHKFKANNIIEIEFLKIKTFQKLIVEGTLNLNNSIRHFKVIKNELMKFYKNKRTLIHGDLGLANVFIKNNTYYLIDFTDSYFDNYNYDLYVLLYCILQYNKVDIEINRNTLVTSLLEINNQVLKKLKVKFSIYNKRRFSKIL